MPFGFAFCTVEKFVCCTAPRQSFKARFRVRCRTTRASGQHMVVKMGIPPIAACIHCALRPSTYCVKGKLIILGNRGQGDPRTDCFRDLYRSHGRTRIGIVLISNSPVKKGGVTFLFLWDDAELVMCGRIIVIRGEGDLCLPRALDRKLPKHNAVIMTESHRNRAGIFCCACRDKNRLSIARKAN